MTITPYPFLNPLYSQVKRKVFISYHHENDQGWANLFRNTFSNSYEVFYDNSLDDEVDSDDYDYIYRRIKEDYIKGSSVTIVLCGAETWKRRFVDWEIHATLYHEHALLGVILSTALKDYQGKFIVPDRLVDNVNSNYAHWITWSSNALDLKNAIDFAISKASKKELISNSREMMKKSVT